MTDEHHWTATNELRYAAVERERTIQGQPCIAYETVLQQKWNRCESLEEYNNRIGLNPHKDIQVLMPGTGPIVSEWRDVPNVGVVDD